jgi:hypothetical protein
VLQEAGLISTADESPLHTRKRVSIVRQSRGKQASPSSKQGGKPASKAKAAAAKGSIDKAPSPPQIAPAISKRAKRGRVG